MHPNLAGKGGKDTMDGLTKVPYQKKKFSYQETN